MKHKLFKKFAQLDFNEYYWAQIHGDLYYGVSSIFNYRTKFLGINVDKQEEQYFHTMKIPEIVVSILHHFAHEEVFDYKATVKTIKTAMENITMDTYSRLSEQQPDLAEGLAKEGALRLTMIDALFNLTWKNPLIKDYLSKDWKFLFEEYSGRATRNIWLVRDVDDIINIISIKLFGDEKSNEVVELKRLLMDKNLSKQFLENVEKGA